MIETVRLSQVQRNKLLRIRKNTGIKNWNVLCRWALCYSLSHDDKPPPYIKGGKTGIEMDWKTFCGSQGEEIYDALSDLVGEDVFYGHIQRGIDILLLKDIYSDVSN